MKLSAQSQGRYFRKVGNYVSESSTPKEDPRWLRVLTAVVVPILNSLIAAAGVILAAYIAVKLA